MIMEIIYTLCFLKRNEHILMLKRNKAPNKGLWNGVGGHIDNGEDPLSCVVREVYEETGFEINNPHFCGVLTWEGFEIPSGGLYLYTAQAPHGVPKKCSEGILEWKSTQWVFSSLEVVSNIHVFGPKILQPTPPTPKIFHFQYRDGVIQQFSMIPLSQDKDS